MLVSVLEHAGQVCALSEHYDFTHARMVSPQSKRSKTKHIRNKYVKQQPGGDGDEGAEMDDDDSDSSSDALFENFIDVDGKLKKPTTKQMLELLKVKVRRCPLEQHGYVVCIFLKPF